MTTIILPDWFLYALAFFMVLDIALDVLRIIKIRYLKLICKNYGEETVRRILEDARK